MHQIKKYFFRSYVEIMNKEAELYRDCHRVLGELSECRQKPFLDKKVENRLLRDGAIRMNGYFAQITPQGDDFFNNEHYLNAAERVENEEKEKELRVRDSLMKQLLVEKVDELNKHNKQKSYVKYIYYGIGAIGTIVSIIKGCGCN